MSLNVAINQPIPNFTFESTDGSHQLDEFKGQQVILYFYPKDNTSGCTCQAENFRDHYSQFQQKGVIILGISRDSLTSHCKFIEKLNLPFPLISDKSEELCNLFQVIKPKKMYGKPVRGIERSTFLINEQGILACEWRGVKCQAMSKKY